MRVHYKSKDYVNITISLELYPTILMSKYQVEHMGQRSGQKIRWTNHVVEVGE